MTVHFNPPFGSPSRPRLFYAAAFGDFNHDGKPDLAVVGSGEVDILLGDGDGTFQQPEHIAVPVGALQLAAGDFNADGKLDSAILFYKTGQPHPTVCSSCSAMETEHLRQDYPVGPLAGSLVVGDFHGDGKLDLVVANQGAEPASLSRRKSFTADREGRSNISTPIVTPVMITNYVGPYSVIAADFNRDGKLDLALTVSTGATGGIAGHARSW